MIDKIRFSKKNLSDSEIKKIVKTSRLQSFDADGLKHYNNQKTKNFDGGLYIKIGFDKTLIIEGSLHKYSTFLKTKQLDNFDCFTMFQAKETLLKLIENIGFDPEKTNVNFYEVGLNIVTEIETKDFLKGVYSIGDFDKEKLFYINPKYKKESVITTEFHKDFRLVYKVYDKIFEMKDKQKKPPNDKSIIRIETEHKRVENIFVIDFFTDANLKRLQKDFFNHWDKLNFLVEIVAPPKTNNTKIELAKILYKKKEVEVLKQIFEQYKNGTMSIKIYYNLKRFIDNWQTEKIFIAKELITPAFFCWQLVLYFRKEAIQ